MSFRCANGHDVDVPTNVTITKCPAYRHGSPCNAALTRVGEGAMKERACEGSHHHADPLRKGSKKGRCDVCGKNVALTKDGKLRVHEGVTA